LSQDQDGPKAALLDSQYASSIMWLKKGLEISPSNVEIKFNLGISYRSFAVAVVAKLERGQKRNLNDVVGAVSNLKLAQQVFEELVETAKATPEIKPGFDIEKVQRYLGEMEENLKRADQHRLHETELAKTLSSQQAQIAEKNDLIRKEKEIMERLEVAKKEEEKAKRDEIAKNNKERLKALSENWSHQNQAQGERKSKRKTKGKGKGKEVGDDEKMVDDSDSSSDEEVPGGEGVVAVAAAAAAAAPASLEMDADEERDLFGEVDDSDDDNVGDGAAAATITAAEEKDLFGDDDSSDDEKVEGGGEGGEGVEEDDEE